MRRLATIKEACAYAKMGQTRLYEEINAGEIAAYKRDRQTLVDLDSIDAMNERRMRPWKAADDRPGDTVTGFALRPAALSQAQYKDKRIDD